LNKKLVVALLVATCIGCACTDEKACAGGCHWERVDRAAKIGVCSNCTEHVGRWDADDRKFTTIANRRIANRNYYRENRKRWDTYNNTRKAKRGKASC
jgi:hypothetical protein